MKPNERLTRLPETPTESENGFRAVMAGIFGSCIAFGFAVGLCFAGMWWLAFGALCYAAAMLWLSWECGCAIEAGEIHQGEQDDEEDAR